MTMNTRQKCRKVQPPTHAPGVAVSVSFLGCVRGLAACFALLLLWGGLTPLEAKIQSRWEATVERGQMRVVRGNAIMNFDASHQTPITIVENDVIRVGAASRVILADTDRARVTLGSHSVMEVRTWKRQEKSGGFLRILFGRIRTKLFRLAAEERFDVKTATATIGVKGSEFRVLVNPGGVAVAMCIEHECIVSANDDSEVVLPAGYTVVSVGEGLQAPESASPEELLELDDDAPPAVADDGDTIDEDTLVDADLVSQEALDDANQESFSDEEIALGSPTDQGDDLLDAPEIPLNLDDAVQNGRLRYLEVAPQPEK